MRYANNKIVRTSSDNSTSDAAANTQKRIMITLRSEEHTSELSHER